MFYNILLITIHSVVHDIGKYKDNGQDGLHWYEFSETEETDLGI